MNAIAIEYQNTTDLIPYARNSRTHSDEQVAQIAASIREFGFTNPVLIDAENGIIAGHGRILGAGKLGMEQVPCIRLGHLTDAQKRAYVIADNKLALNAGWDEEMLRLEIADLHDLDFDLDLLGFSDDELAEFLEDEEEQKTGLTDQDATPEPPAVPVTKLGYVWVLGNHRVMCGDSTSADSVAVLFGGVSPHLMITDPPYGVEHDPNWRNVAFVPAARAIGQVINDDRADWREAWSLFPGDVAYVWHSSTFTHVVAESLLACGFEMRSLIVWAKHRLVIGRGHYHHMHEPCWYAVKKGKTGNWNGDRKQTTVWSMEHNKSETGHGTQKPVDAMRRPIENNSKKGESIYDPFSGSGTTIIAAEQTGRHCYAMELSPNYVDVAVQRWQNFTGKTAVLESTDQTFNELADNVR